MQCVPRKRWELASCVAVVVVLLVKCARFCASCIDFRGGKRQDNRWPSDQAECLKFFPALLPIINVNSLCVELTSLLHYLFTSKIGNSGL